MIEEPPQVEEPSQAPPEPTKIEEKGVEVEKRLPDEDAKDNLYNLLLEELSTKPAHVFRDLVSELDPKKKTQSPDLKTKKRILDLQFLQQAPNPNFDPVHPSPLASPRAAELQQMRSPSPEYNKLSPLETKVGYPNIYNSKDPLTEYKLCLNNSATSEISFEIKDYPQAADLTPVVEEEVEDPSKPTLSVKVNVDEDTEKVLENQKLESDELKKANKNDDFSPILPPGLSAYHRVQSRYQKEPEIAPRSSVKTLGSGVRVVPKPLVHNFIQKPGFPKPDDGQDLDQAIELQTLKAQASSLEKMLDMEFQADPSPITKVFDPVLPISSNFSFDKKISITKKKKKKRKFKNRFKVLFGKPKVPRPLVTMPKAHTTNILDNITKVAKPVGKMLFGKPKTSTFTSNNNHIGLRTKIETKLHKKSPKLPVPRLQIPQTTPITGFSPKTRILDLVGIRVSGYWFTQLTRLNCSEFIDSKFLYSSEIKTPLSDLGFKSYLLVNKKKLALFTREGTNELELQMMCETSEIRDVIYQASSKSIVLIFNTCKKI